MIRALSAKFADLVDALDVPSTGGMARVIVSPAFAGMELQDPPGSILGGTRKSVDAHWVGGVGPIAVLTPAEANPSQYMSDESVILQNEHAGDEQSERRPNDY
jgi:hypothetical protein